MDACARPDLNLYGYCNNNIVEIAHAFNSIIFLNTFFQIDLIERAFVWLLNQISISEREKKTSLVLVTSLSVTLKALYFPQAHHWNRAKNQRSEEGYTEI